MEEGSFCHVAVTASAFGPCSSNMCPSGESMTLLRAYRDGWNGMDPCCSSSSGMTENCCPQWVMSGMTPASATSYTRGVIGAPIYDQSGGECFGCEERFYGIVKDVRIFSAVLFPAPLRPRKPTASPLGISKLRPEMALVVP